MEGQRTTKKRIDTLFFAHSIMAGVLGTIAFVLPHMFEYFLVHHGEKFSLRDNSDSSQKVTHLVTRLYGALILGQVTPGGGLTQWNWANIFLFTFLAVAYGWFAFFERIQCFEGLGKAVQ